MGRVGESHDRTQAALDDVKEDAKGVSQVRVEVEKKEYVLCTLRPGKVDQCTLNIFISEGERVTFRISGNQYVLVAAVQAGTTCLTASLTALKTMTFTAVST